MTQRILICEDHGLVREALVALISSELAGCLVDQAPDFSAAWAACDAASYDLIVCDLMMPGADPRTGFEGFRRRNPDALLCVVTGLQDMDLMRDLLRQGTQGFISKTCSGDVIIAALRLILAGGRYTPPEVIALLDQDRTLAEREQAPAIRLTPQQKRVLTLLSERQSNKAMALQLGVAPSTVKTHLDQIMRILDVNNRHDAVTRASELRLL